MASNEIVSERPQRAITISEALPGAPAGTADDLLRAVVRHWLLALLVTAAVTVLATLFASVQPKRYHAECMTAVGLLPSAMTPSETLHGLETLDRRLVVASLAALTETPALRQQVNAAPDDKIDATVLPSTSLVRIAVDGRDPRRVAAVANAIPAVLAVQARSMYSIYSVTTVSPATPASKPSSPRLDRAAAAGLFLGVLCGVAVAFAADRRLRGPSMQ